MGFGPLFHMYGALINLKSCSLIKIYFVHRLCLCTLWSFSFIDWSCAVAVHMNSDSTVLCSVSEMDWVFMWVWFYRRAVWIFILYQYSDHLIFKFFDW